MGEACVTLIMLHSQEETAGLGKNHSQQPSAVNSNGSLEGERELFVFGLLLGPYSSCNQLCISHILYRDVCVGVISL